MQESTQGQATIVLPIECEPRRLNGVSVVLNVMLLPFFACFFRISKQAY